MSEVHIIEGSHQSLDDPPPPHLTQLPVLSTQPEPPCIEPVPIYPDQIQSFNGIPTSSETAIKVENVWKKYERDQYVLQNYNMTVPKGSIYSLLGSSGCGKTTILSCVVGRQTWDSGTISVLGSPPSTKRCANTDCRKVGYMPQDLSLQERLTIKELLLLYGRLYGMNAIDILTRYQFLQNFLQLPKEDKVLANLSGGQQRRASLAVALLHEPDLIILDEPTVGLDPLLRQSIWEHLQDLVVNLQVTIVLTTHYVDEARRSNVIGLMRHGSIIAEESPQELMRQYESSSLDQIVLRICKRDQETKASSRKISAANGLLPMSEVISSAPPSSRHHDHEPRKVFYAKGKLSKVHGEQQVMDEENGNVIFLKYTNSSSGATSDSILPQPPQESQQHCLARTFAKELMGSVKSRRKCVSRSFNMLRRIKGLIWATYLATFRHPAFIPLTFILPAVTAALVQFVFGSDLHDLKFGYVINDEPFSNLSDFANASKHLEKANCFESKFSHLFLNKISSDALILVPFASKSEALKAVEKGDLWGFLNIPANYTMHMRDRMLSRQFSEPETINGTIIGIHLDMSSFLGSILVLQKLSDAYQTFLKELATSCGLPSGEFEIPLKYDTPVYGDLEGSYAEHVVPGLLLVLIFVLPLGACSVSVIQERNAGCMDRMRVSGMANWDIIMTYFVTHGSFQMVQMTLCTVVLVFGFSYVIKGPILLYIIVNVCNSACGLAFGFLLGLLCATELQALIVVFFIASFLLPFSGAFWPVECLQIYWRMVAYCLPTTLVSQSFRSVVFRGLSYTHFLVWPGLVIPLLWMCVFLALCLFILRRY